ncbi:MAG: Xaa-Pro peptidase family protein [Candidatus Onthomonas sp.]|nr:Xaa-Pro peptidase family protein [Candidatus Onthomonas sp.]
MNHLEHIRRRLSDTELDALILTSEPGEYYAVGMKGEGLVLITGEDSHYFTDSRYIELAEQTVDHARVAMTTPDRSQLVLAGEVLAARGLRRVGIEEPYLTVEMYRKMEQVFPPETELIPAGALLTELRGAKDTEELDRMRKAQEITDRVFLEILNDLKPGVTERQIAARITYLHMCYGAEKNSFDPIVASGSNGSMPHAIPGDKPISQGEFVTMDFGCVYQGYCSDMTRTVAVGEPGEEMRQVYDAVLRAQLAGIAKAKAGVPGCEIHNAAWQVLKDAGYGDYFGHGFGHGLGLEIHEKPNANLSNREPLLEGAVISAEPGVYLPGRFGVRIEDVLWLTREGNVDLTQSPKELIVL